MSGSATPRHLAGRHRRQPRPHHPWAGQRAGVVFQAAPSRPFHYRCLASTASSLYPHHTHLVLLLLLFRCWRVDCNPLLCPFFLIFPLKKKSIIPGLPPSPYRKSHSQSMGNQAVPGRAVILLFNPSFPLRLAQTTGPLSTSPLCLATPYFPDPS